MQLKRIQIKNYKKLLNTDLSLENDITLIAGPNNSGKTSIIEVLKFLLTDNKDKIELSEINTKKLNEWIENFFEKYKLILEKNLKDDILIEEITTFFINNSLNSEEILPVVCLEVGYDKKIDNLTDIIRFTYELGESNSVFFKYKCILNEEKFKKLLIDNNKKILKRFNNEKSDEVHKKHSIYRIIKSIIQSSIDERFYYTNSSYLDESSVLKTEFKSLFNVKIVTALRKLDDNKDDSNYSLSKSMINVVSKKEEYVNKLDNISDSLYQKLEENNIEEFILNESLSKFNLELKDTSGSEYFAKIGLLINPESEDINGLLKESTSAQYSVENIKLEEYSQGLGYSNMVYLHMIQQNFENSIDLSKINIMVIEEPESHMHPQMQSSFFKKILSYYKSNTSQCIISTHSTEIVNNIEDIKKIRVLRNTNNAFESKLYDLRLFSNMIKGKKYDDTITKIDFYNFFFTVGFPNIIFSNKVILFEGDTERIFLKYIIKNKFEGLNSDYISYVQVGGAYAKNYFDLLKYLNIKTLVLTDIDYNQDIIEKDKILKSTSTNATINYSYNSLNAFVKNKDTQIECLSEEKQVEETIERDDAIDDNNIISIDKIYKWLKDDSNNLIGIYTQSEDDKYCRTLEEAMLAKFLNINIWDSKNKSEWIQVRKNNHLVFTIPRKENITIRDIVKSSSNNKTDFMYSAIISSKYLDMIPNYIQQGLEWLDGRK